MKKGFLIGIILLLVGFAFITINIAVDYNGQCGGLLPFLAGTTECSFTQYFSQNIQFTLLILVTQFWWAILFILLIPTLAGWFISKVREKGGIH